MTDQQIRQVPVPLEALINAFESEGAEERMVLDLDNGDVFPITGPDDVDWPEVKAGLGTQFLTIPRSDGAELAEDMLAFTQQVTDPDLRVGLEAAQGEGLSAFRGVLRDWPTERGQWLLFRDQRVFARVLKWLTAQGLESNARCDCHDD